MCDSSRGVRPRRYAATTLPELVQTPASGAIEPGTTPASRWTTINESIYPHERSALDRIRAAMPDTDPWRAWSNFTFATGRGQFYEVDLLIAAPSGLHMVELKAWNGEVTATRAGWVQTNAAGEEVEHGRPIRLAIHKSSALRRLLAAAGEHVYIRTLIGFSDNRLRTYLSGPELRYVRPVDSLVPELSRRAHDARNRMTAARVERIGRALEFVGIAGSDTPLWPVSGPKE